jgi:Short C-terminal domain
VGLRNWAENTLTTKNGKSIKIRDGEIAFGKEGGPIAGARATVDTAGALDKRVTATRLILTGPLAFGLRKKKDNRELYLLVEGNGFAFSAEIDPKRGALARKFATRINALGQEAGLSGQGNGDSSAPAGADRLDKLQQLVSLRDAGALTPEEFEAEKSRIMSAE